MQIQNTARQNIARLYGRQQMPGGADSTAGPGATSARPRTDSVAVSATRLEVAQVQVTVAAQPDARADRVSAFKASIASGAYQVNGRALAGRLLEAAG